MGQGIQEAGSTKTHDNSATRMMLFVGCSFTETLASVPARGCGLGEKVLPMPETAPAMSVELAPAIRPSQMAVMGPVTIQSM